MLLCEPSFVVGGADSVRDEVLVRLGALPQHQRSDRRSLYKPLLVLLALARLSGHGSSEVPWIPAHRHVRCHQQRPRPTRTRASFTIALNNTARDQIVQAARHPARPVRRIPAAP
jgi:hypothetical protein